ncbi:MAG: hypothetical protein II935_00040, partial [Bacteroidales bacterium]|nr:hypothetical protein [Bacteroidales bacterium]
MPSVAGFRISAHNAGDSVSAFTNEIPTATAIVKPNCQKNMPVVPPINETGMKITINTSEVVNNVTDKPFIAPTEASCADL